MGKDADKQTKRVHKKTQPVRYIKFFANDILSVNVNLSIL